MISLLNKLGRRMVSDRGEKLNNPRLFSSTAKRVLSVLFLLILGFSFLPTFDIHVSAATATGTPILLDYEFYEDDTGMYHFDVTVQASVFNPTSGYAGVGETHYYMNDGTGRNGVTWYNRGNVTWTDSTAKEVWTLHCSFYADYVGPQSVNMTVYDTFTGQTIHAGSASATFTATEKNLAPDSLVANNKPTATLVYELTPRSGGFYYSVWTGYGRGRPINNYTIYWRPQGTTTWNSKVIATASMGRVSGNITGLVNGTVYEFYTSATNANGTSTSTIRTVTPGTPTAPRNLKTIPGNGSVTWTWDEPADLRGGTIQGYQLVWQYNAAVLVANTGKVNSYTYPVSNGTYTGTSAPTVRVSSIVEYGLGEMSGVFPSVWVGSPQPVANACCIMLNS